MNFHTLLQVFLFPAPPFVMATTLYSLVSLTISARRETIGKHVQYSKLVNLESISKGETKSIQSKLGMLVSYSPAFLFAAASFLIFPDGGLRFYLVRLSFTIHFLKRVLEVLFVHKYSGRMAIKAMFAISANYLLIVFAAIYAAHLSCGLPEPSMDLKYAGIILFLLGIGGNFYHHYLLSALRGKGDKQYKIPKGGMFNLVICPHYFFEAVGFLGISFISQTLYSFSFAFGSALFLMARSNATRKWYMSKFEDFPKEVKAIIPFIF